MEPIVFVEIVMDVQFVLVFKDIWVLHHHVDQNVFKVPNVIKIWPVLIRNVKIHVLELAVLMLDVVFLVIIQFVVVQLDTLVIRLNNVHQNVSLIFFNSLFIKPN